MDVRVSALGLPLTDVPGVETFAQRALAKLLNTHFVEPGRSSVNVCRLFAKQTLAKERGAGGTLCVALLSASLPEPSDGSLPPSTFVELRLLGGPAPGWSSADDFSSPRAAVAVARSHVAPASSEPCWCQLLTLPAPRDRYLRLRLRLVHWAALGEPETLGEGEAPFQSTPGGQLMPLEIRLSPAGTLKLSLAVLPPGEEVQALAWAMETAAQRPSPPASPAGGAHPLLATRPLAEVASADAEEPEEAHPSHAPLSHAHAHAHAHAQQQTQARPPPRPSHARTPSDGLPLAARPPPRPAAAGVMAGARELLSSIAQGGASGGHGLSHAVGRLASAVAQAAHDAEGGHAMEEEEGMISPGRRPRRLLPSATPGHSRHASWDGGSQVPDFARPPRGRRRSPSPLRRRERSASHASAQDLENESDAEFRARCAALGRAELARVCSEEREARRAAAARAAELEKELASIRELRELEDVRAMVEGARFLVHSRGGSKLRLLWFNAARRRLCWAAGADRKADAAAAVHSLPLASVDRAELGTLHFEQPQPGSAGGWGFRGGAAPPNPRCSLSVLSKPAAGDAEQSGGKGKAPATSLNLELPPGGNGRSAQEWAAAIATLLRREAAGPKAPGVLQGALTGVVGLLHGSAHPHPPPAAVPASGSARIQPTPSRASRAAAAALQLLDGVSVAKEGGSLAASVDGTRCPSPEPGWPGEEDEGGPVDVEGDETRRQLLLSA
jgi:hypothetical protein